MGTDERLQAMWADMECDQLDELDETEKSARRTTTMKIEPPVCLPREEIQVCAEDVFFALQSLNRGLQAAEEFSKAQEWGQALGTLEGHVKGARDDLGAVMGHLERFMPNHVEPEQEFAEQDADIEERGWLDGEDEKSYSARHA